MNNQTSEYRKTLIELEQKIGEGYDKTLIALSGGALGVTITFIKDIVGESKIIFSGLALTAWSAWALSLSCLLAAFYFGTRAYRYAIQKLDEGKLNSANPGGIYSTITNCLNVIGGVSFISGVILFVWFAYRNLGGQ